MENYEKSDFSNNEKLWGMVVHLSALVQFIFHFFGLIIGPLLVWLIKKDTMPFVREQGKEALNFNISIALYAIVLAVGLGLMPFSLHGMLLRNLIPSSIDGTWMGIFSSIYLVFLVGIFLALFLFWLVNIIRAAISANQGVAFHYPLAIKFIT